MAGEYVVYWSIPIDRCKSIAMKSDTDWYLAIYREAD